MLQPNLDKTMLMEWYKRERKDINYMFQQIMLFLDRREINLIITKQQFYDKFIEFLYSFNYLKN